MAQDQQDTITLDEIHAFLRDTEVTPKCWFCGNNSVVVLPEQTFDSDGNGSSTNRPAMLERVVQTDTETEEEATVPAFVMSCYCCGMTYDMLIIPFKHWKRRQAEHGDD